MINKLGTASSLSFSDLWFLVQAWITLLVIDLGLRFGLYSRIQGAVARRVKVARNATPPQAAELVERARLHVLRAGRYHLIPMTCLRRTLALQWLLARRSIATDLRFGARKEAGQLQAHAWLEFQGLPIGEPERISEDFLPLLPSS